MLLRLAFSPKADADFPKLVDLWTFAFSRALGNMIPNLDEPRINKAFGESTAKLTSWPSPKQIIDLMPRRPHQQHVDYTPAKDYEVGKSMMAICMQLIDGKITKAEADQQMQDLIK